MVPLRHVIVRQREPLGLTPETLPALAAVLVTGDDSERFDTAALRDLADHGAARDRAARAARAAARARLSRRDGAGVVGARPTVDGVTVTAVPTSARHRRERLRRGLADARPVLRRGPDRTRFAGMVDIAVAFPHLDVAILPIGGRRVFGSSTR